VNNNPLRYSDPSGHFAWLPVIVAAGALLGAAIDYGTQVYSNYQSNGENLGAALTTNIDLAAVGKSALAGAAVGLTVAVAAPVAIAAAGDVLTGAGLALGSTELFGAGMAAYGAATALENALLGTSTAVAAAETTALAKYDPEFAAQQLIEGDTIPVSNMEAMIPEGTPNTFVPSQTIAEGYKYQFDINGTSVELKWHSPDFNAYQLYGSSSYSGTRWTAQVKVGKWLLGLDRLFYDEQRGNLTHIPIEWR
ncbi:MAG: hypothetical protein ACP5Q1_09475, partial [Anaerolineae bacterium]